LKKRRSFLQLSGGAAAVFALGNPLARRAEHQPALGGTRICRGRSDGPVKASFTIGQAPLPGGTIPKYVDPLPVFTNQRVSGSEITVAATEFRQQILPANVYAVLPSPFDKGTLVWGYQVGNAAPNYPGFTIEAQRGTATTVTYRNDLPYRHCCRAI
jgi:FtsP/CotA-like multicopper oxidase with cupredoxin domain